MSQNIDYKVRRSKFSINTRIFHHSLLLILIVLVDAVSQAVMEAVDVYIRGLGLVIFSLKFFPRCKLNLFSCMCTLLISCHNLDYRLGKWSWLVWRYCLSIHLNVLRKIKKNISYVSDQDLDMVPSKYCESTFCWTNRLSHLEGFYFFGAV
jgi:hypothetical protein